MQDKALVRTVGISSSPNRKKAGLSALSHSAAIRVLYGVTVVEIRYRKYRTYVAPYLEYVRIGGAGCSTPLLHPIHTILGCQSYVSKKPTVKVKQTPVS